MSDNKDNYLELAAYAGHARLESDKDFSTFEQDGEFYFAMLDANDNVVFRSEGYASEKSRSNGIKSVIKNREVEKRYAILEEDGKFYLALKAGNHQEIARSGEVADETAAWAIRDQWVVKEGEETAEPTEMGAVEEETPAAETEVAKVEAPEAKEEAQKEEATGAAEETPEEETAEENSGVVQMVQEEAPTKEEEEEEEEEEVDDAPDFIDESALDHSSTPHDDFDWSLGNRNTVPYSSERKKEMMAEYDTTLSSVIENEVVKAKVNTISGGDVVLDINFKSDGLVSLSEFRDMPELKAGDEVDVYVERQEDERGQLVLSRRKAKLIKAWENIKASYTDGIVIKGTVISKTKGGLIVDCSGLETFLPGSQIDIKPIIDYDAYVGKTMEFKVVKINEQIKNAVVSHKALIESDLAEQREQIIRGLEKGQVLEGLVKNITDFGAFLDLGGVDGLLYITDISWGRISHPREVLELNQKINVVVLDFDEGKKRISLGLKQLQPHPWEVLGDTISEGAAVKGRVVNIEDYGAFLEIVPGVEGLVHVSEVSWGNQPVNAREFFKVGEIYDAKIVTLNHNDRKMSLSLKQMTPDPWSVIEERFPIESRHTGLVKNLTPYGVFVELEDGIGGMIHISDLSWTKRYGHPSEFTRVGREIDVMILNINKDNRKMSLGHKQLEENPWDTFETLFPEGSYHEATVVRRDDKGAIVQLPYGLEAFAPMRHIKKEDGSPVNQDEVLTFKVLEFDRDSKRIVVSHTRYLQDIRREADDEVRKERRKERKQVSDAVRKQQSTIERTTLGDLDVFSQLKNQLNDGDDK